MKHHCQDGDWECWEAANPSRLQISHRGRDSYAQTLVDFCPFCGFSLGKHGARPQWVSKDHFPATRKETSLRFDEIERRLERLERIRKPIPFGYNPVNAVGEIANQLRYWVKFRELEQPCNDASHVIPPQWPTVGQLKTWIQVLDDLTGEQDAM